MLPIGALSAVDAYMLLFFMINLVQVLRFLMLERRMCMSCCLFVVVFATLQTDLNFKYSTLFELLPVTPLAYWSASYKHEHGLSFSLCRIISVCSLFMISHRFKIEVSFYVENGADDKYCIFP